MRVEYFRTTVLLLGSALLITLGYGCSKKGPTEPPAEREAPSEVAAYVDRSGGNVLLADGAGIIVPPEAIVDSTWFRVSKIVEKGMPDNGRRYRFECQGEFSGMVTLILRFNAEDIPGTPSSEDVVVLHLDPEKVFTQCPIDSIRGDLAYISTSHLSDYEIRWNTKPKKVPSISKRLSIPYYHQYQTGWCWAHCLAMMEKAYTTDVELAHESWYYGVKLGKSAYEGEEPSPGLPSFEFWTSTTLSGIFASVFGSEGYSRGSFFFKNSLRNHLIRCIDEGKPVVVILQGERHFVVVVGYENSSSGLKFILNDPAQSSGYKRTWSDIEDKWRLGDFYSTLTPTDRPVCTSAATVQLPPSGVRQRNFKWYGERGLVFVPPKEGVASCLWDWPKAKAFNYDGREKDGYFYINGDAIPDTNYMYLSPEVFNGGTNPFTGEIRYNIYKEDGTEVYSPSAKTVNIPPDGRQIVKFPPVQVSTFADTSGLYRLDISLRSKNDLIDKASVNFRVKYTLQICPVFTEEDCKELVPPGYLIDPDHLCIDTFSFAGILALSKLYFRSYGEGEPRPEAYVWITCCAQECVDRHMEELVDLWTGFKKELFDHDNEIRARWGFKEPATISISPDGRRIEAHEPTTVRFDRQLQFWVVDPIRVDYLNFSYKDFYVVEIETKVLDQTDYIANKAMKLIDRKMKENQ